MIEFIYNLFCSHNMRTYLYCVRRTYTCWIVVVHIFFKNITRKQTVNFGLKIVDTIIINILSRLTNNELIND